MKWDHWLAEHPLLSSLLGALIGLIAMLLVILLLT